MHKKLELELMSIAHSILQMKNKNDVNALKDKAQELYERLSVLAFVDEYLATTPGVKETKKELVGELEKAIKEKTSDVVVKEIAEEVVVEKTITVTETIVEEVVVDVKEVVEEVVPIAVVEKERSVKTVASIKKARTLEEEFKDAVSVDITQDLFQKVEVKRTTVKASLNDTLMQKNIQVGLNDRIAFVKHLFNHSQADFNRVLSQLNSIDNEIEAKNFIAKMVKPDYEWSGKEGYEERLLELIERRFK